MFKSCLSLVLCLFPGPESAAERTRHGARERQGHWLCCSHLHGSAGTDHSWCGPWSLGQCCRQCSHCDFSINGGTGWLLLCCFLCSICEVRLCETIGRKKPRRSALLLCWYCWYLLFPYLLGAAAIMEHHLTTKWRLDEIGCLMPQVESFSILSALLLPSCWPQCMDMLLHLKTHLPVVCWYPTWGVIVKLIISLWKRIDEVCVELKKLIEQS